MVRLLAIAAIAAALLAALTALVLDDAARFAAVAVAIACGVVLLMQRAMPGWVGGAAVLVLAILGAMGAAGSVSTEGGGGTSLGISEPLGTALLVTSLVLVPLAAVWLRWGLMPAWALAVGGGAAVLAILFAFLGMDDLGPGFEVMNILTTVFCLLSALPAVVLLATPAPAAEPPPRTPRVRTAKTR